MLKVPNRIPQKSVATVSGALQNPVQSSIRPRPSFQDLIPIAQIRRKSLVDLQNRLRRFSLHPISLRKSKGIEIKNRTTIGPVALGKGGIVVRQMWA